MDTDLDHVGGCMANHSKFIKLLLSFVIAISPIILINNANAASLGGWTLGGGVAQGASTVYNGTKNVLINGKNVVQKGVATVTPTATGVAKVLGRGVAGYALSVAVEQLLGAVDWVMKDGAIVYTEPKLIYKWCQSGTCVVTSEKEYFTNWCTASVSPNYTRYSLVEVKKDEFKLTCIHKEGYKSVWDQTFDRSLVEDKPEEKSIPLEVVAAQVISNAESETDVQKKAAAQEATTAAAADIVAEAEKDSTKARPIVNQLESSAETATDETATGEATKPNTADPTAPPDVTNISLKFPVFCGWAPTVCHAASVVISFPTLVTEWWETANTKADGWATSISESWAAAKEWATSEPSQDNTQVDVENNNTQEIDTQVSFSTQCPAPINLANFSYHGISQSWTVDFSKFCDVFATYLRPVVISIGAFSAVLIVSGVGVRENG